MAILIHLLSFFKHYLHRHNTLPITSSFLSSGSAWMSRSEHLTVKTVLPHEWLQLLFQDLKQSPSQVQSVSGCSEIKENPTEAVVYFLMCQTKLKLYIWTHIIPNPTSRMSLIRVILWKGRTRKDLRFRLWHTGSLSSFLIEYRKSLFCCLEKKKGSDVFERVLWEVGVQEWYQVQNRDLQQLVHKGLLVHHVSHIWHIEAVKV